MSLSKKNEYILIIVAAWLVMSGGAAIAGGGECSRSSMFTAVALAGCAVLTYFVIYPVNCKKTEE